MHDHVCTTVVKITLPRGTIQSNGCTGVEKESGNSKLHEVVTGELVDVVPTSVEGAGPVMVPISIDLSCATDFSTCGSAAPSVFVPLSAGAGLDNEPELSEAAWGRLAEFRTPGSGLLEAVTGLSETRGLGCDNLIPSVLCIFLWRVISSRILSSRATRFCTLLGVRVAPAEKWKKQKCMKNTSHSLGHFMRANYWKDEWIIKMQVMVMELPINKSHGVSPGVLLGVTGLLSAPMSSKSNSVGGFLQKDKSALIFFKSIWWDFVDMEFYIIFNNISEIMSTQCDSEHEDFGSLSRGFMFNQIQVCTHVLESMRQYGNWIVRQLYITPDKKLTKCMRKEAHRWCLETCENSLGLHGLVER